MGRPAKYKTAEALEKACNEYFEECDNHTVEILVKGKKDEADKIEKVAAPKPYTVVNLALSLGFIDRHALLNYKGRSKEFYATVKRALSRIEGQTVIDGLTRKRSEPMSIFLLKANYKYSDKVELEITGPGGGPIAITAFPPEPKALIDWERQIIAARKAKQLPDKTKRG